MVGEAFDAWNRLWQELGVVHYAETGTLVLSADRSAWASRSLNALRQAQIPVQPMGSEELRQTYPYLHTADVPLGYYLPSGGLLFARRILESLTNYLRRKGVRILAETRIARVDPARAVVYEQGGTEKAFDLLVVAAGPWLPDLLPALQPVVTPSRQVVLYLDPPDHTEVDWASMPVILDIDPSTGLYIVPPREDTGLKVGDHRFSREGHPDRDRDLKDRDLAILRIARKRVLPLQKAALARFRSCFYTVAEQERFIVHSLGPTWVLTGFSGHGFKFGPLVGERFAAQCIASNNIAAFSKWLAGYPSTSSSG